MKKVSIYLLTFMMILLCQHLDANAESETWVCPNCRQDAVGNFCSNCGTKRPEKKNDEEKYADKSFLQDFSSGLNRRWENSQNKKEPLPFFVNDFKQYRSELVELELDAIEKYTDKVFEDERLKLYALIYICGLKNQSKAINEYYGKDMNLYNQYWQELGYDYRAAMLYFITLDYEVNIDNENLDLYNETILNGMAVANYNLEEYNINGLIKQEISSEPNEMPLKGIWYDDEGIRITCTNYGLTEDSLGIIIRFDLVVENNTDKSISAGIKNDSLDGWAIGTLGNFCNNGLPGGQKLRTNENIYIEKAGFTSFEDVKNYKFVLWIDPDKQDIKNPDMEVMVEVASIPVYDKNQTSYEDNWAKGVQLTADKDVNLESIVNEILSYKNTQTEKAYSLIQKYAKSFSEQQLTKCLLSYARWKSIEPAEEKIKSYLKSPRSYYRYSGSITEPDLQTDGSYKVSLKIKYGATNSFGAEVTDEVTVNVCFTIDRTNLEVEYISTKLSAYDAFRLSN